jgi:diguanylate cyclase (GGDEF)-like protein/PAS domain S-box-containing protein
MNFDKNNSRMGQVATQSELEIIWNNTNDTIFLIAPDGSVIKANPSFERMLGYTAEDLKDDPTPPIIPEHLIKDQEPFLVKMKLGEIITYYEAQRLTKSGSLIDIVASYRPILSESGELEFIVAMYKDITEQKETQRRLIESEQKYRFIAENTTDLIQVLNESGTIFYISPSVKDILDFPSEELLDLRLIDYIHDEDKRKFKLMLSKLKGNKTSFQVEFRYKTRSNEYKWCEVKGTCVPDNGVLKYILVSRDINDRKRYEEELKRLAFHDPLTGLPNRRLFIANLIEELGKASGTEESFTVFYLDMDNLKQINDELGHNIGDSVLIEFGKRLKQSVRETDIVCRMGGDEFVILASLCNKEKASLFANRILNSLSVPVKVGEQEVSISTSIGICVNCGETENSSPEFVIKKADDALYTAKNNGKNRFEFCAMDSNR